MQSPPDIREATRADLPGIIALLADDDLGRGRENPSVPPDARYIAAFDAVLSDPNQCQIVVADGSRIIGTMQLTFIPGLSRLGAWRAQIEAVRIARDHRGTGLGARLFDFAIGRARERGCTLIQLTTDKSRPDAHRFYDRLGFEASHIGYKLAL